MQDLAFVFVNWKQVTLKRTSQTALSETSRKEIFKGSGYTITLITKDVKALGEELTLEKGTLEIRHDKDVILVRVHGEAGC